MPNAFLRTVSPTIGLFVATALYLSLAGCSGGFGRRMAWPPPQSTDQPVTEAAARFSQVSTPGGTLQTVVYSATVGEANSLQPNRESSGETLDLAPLVETVLAVHPDIHSARAAWRGHVIRRPSRWTTQCLA
jgi:hypothetical protein